MVKINNLKGTSVIVVAIVIAVFALSLRVIVIQLINKNMSQNESGAQATLKLISTALENYAKKNQSVYPSNLSILVKSKPSYLDRDYTQEPSVKGYNYSCRIDASGYNCSAIPLKCKFSGRIVYSVSTGGLLISEECKKQ